jgi:hypothetical protein
MFINRSNEKDERVMKILRQRTQEVEVKKFCIRLIEEAGSFQYTKVRSTVVNTILYSSK